MVIFAAATYECSEGEECNGESGGDGGESTTTPTAGEWITQQTRDVDHTLVHCWANVVDGGSAVSQPMSQRLVSAGTH